MLTDGVDIITSGLAILPAFSELKEVDRNFLVAHNENYRTDHLTLGTGINEYFSEIINMVKSIISYILVTVFSFMLIYLVIKQRHTINSLLLKLCQGLADCGNLIPSRCRHNNIENNDIDENFV